ncbi:hypothetical protein BpHYR1_039137 [Brachionus plicatilis]|uniref:Uncharacterized protein n=1 Tax=Brachionus plicatilis TaxID=10195 RepID=A0A3M7QKE2_BRAPC|nr:hypothetical protein BpHYR1_039137 [Brachionus plicatilis]
MTKKCSNFLFSYKNSKKKKKQKLFSVHSTYFKFFAQLNVGRQILEAIADQIQYRVGTVRREGKLMTKHLVPNGAERVHIGRLRKCGLNASSADHFD